MDDAPKGRIEDVNNTPADHDSVARWRCAVCDEVIAVTGNGAPWNHMVWPIQNLFYDVAEHVERHQSLPEP